SLKDPFQRLARNPSAIILNENLHVAVTCGVATDGDITIRTPVLDGVVYQISKNLFQPVSIRAEGYIGRLVEHADVPGAHAHFQIVNDFVHHRPERDDLKVEFDAARFQL